MGAAAGVYDLTDPQDLVFFVLIEACLGASLWHLLSLTSPMEKPMNDRDASVINRQAAALAETIMEDHRLRLGDWDRHRLVLLIAAVIRLCIAMMGTGPIEKHATHYGKTNPN